MCRHWYQRSLSRYGEQTANRIHITCIHKNFSSKYLLNVVHNEIVRAQPITELENLREKRCKEKQEW